MTNRAVVTIAGQADRERVATWAKNVEVGTIVEFRKKTRSHEQNAKLHAMLGEVAEQVVWYGRKLDIDDWKHLFTASLRNADVVPGIDRGTVVPLGMKTSAMTIEEMGNLIELIYAFGSDPEHPVTFKEPQEHTETSAAPSADAGGEVARPDDLTSAPAADEAVNEPDEELDTSADTSSGSTIPGMTRMLMEECIEGMLRSALSKPDSAALKEIEKLIEVFKGEQPMADHHNFIDLCAETSRRIVGKPAEQPRAKSYLLTKVPAVETVEVS